MPQAERAAPECAPPPQQSDWVETEVAATVDGELEVGATAVATGNDCPAADSDGLIGFSVVAGCRSAQVELTTPLPSVLTPSSSPSPLLRFSVNPTLNKPPPLDTAVLAKYSLSGRPVAGLVW
jgi:hypothetical protein